MNIAVEGETNLIGSVIGGGNTTLIRGELEYSDIHDKDKGYNFGISGRASFSKTDKMDGVANVVGGNAGNVIRDEQLEYLFNIDKIRAQEEGRIFYINKQKLNPFTAHSFIYAGKKITTPSYRKWQKIRNGYDDILRLFNSDTYKDFFNNKKEEKNGSDKNEK